MFEVSIKTPFYFNYDLTIITILFIPCNIPTNVHFGRQHLLHHLKTTLLDVNCVTQTTILLLYPVTRVLILHHETNYSVNSHHCDEDHKSHFTYWPSSIQDITDVG